MEQVAKASVEAQVEVNDDKYLKIDFGVNFANKKRYNNVVLNEILEESFLNKVEHVVSISNNISECHINIENGQKYPMLYFTLGIHPHNAKELREGDIEFIESNLENPKCFGIGECGLDFNRNFSPREKQLEVFELQILLAKKHNKKLYMHCRDAFDDFINLLKKHDYFNGIVHCFTGDEEQAIELTQLGFKLGITGWLLDKRRNEDLVKVIRNNNITLDMLLVETDAPFMPVNKKSKQSSPKDTEYVIASIAYLKRINEIDCARILYENAKNFLVI